MLIIALGLLIICRYFSWLLNNNSHTTRLLFLRLFQHFYILYIFHLGSSSWNRARLLSLHLLCVLPSLSSLWGRPLNIQLNLLITSTWCTWSMSHIFFFLAHQISTPWTWDTSSTALDALAQSGNLFLQREQWELILLFFFL